jgi:hypothetical protein
MNSVMTSINIAGPDDIPVTDNAFYLYEFPKDWNTKNILDVFKDAKPIQVKWIDDTSCFLFIKSRSKISIVEKILNERLPNKSFPFLLKTWDEHQNSNVVSCLDEERNPRKRARSNEPLGSKRNIKECIIS